MERYYELSREKDSFLCVGLDPATGDMRERYVVPPGLIERYGLSEGIKRFCLAVIEAVAPFTPVIKPNAQFITYPLSLEDLREVVEAIHEGGCLALLDAKLSDIGSTNGAGLHWIAEMGFDAVTFSPFPGFTDGSDAVYGWARRGKGIFALCRMSNPGAHDYQSLMVEGEPLYLRLARDAYRRGCNGFVVGCTAPSELGEVRTVIGEERLILAPGLGPQGGDPALALSLGGNSEGEGLIVASSRSIDYAYETLGWSWEKFAEAAAAQAERKRDELNQLKRRVLA
ncbi:MAG: orotidine-5'-phosphate decarboxylase [Candidatus Bathyarchaeota archaeon]|nr:orotidine-5'-phosphate decarboxylase [Candidatus Bathyarchaeota archaeon]